MIDKKSANLSPCEAPAQSDTTIAGAFSSLEASRIRRFSPLLTEEIVQRVRDGETALEERARALAEASKEWRDVYSARTEENRAKRGTLLRRIVHPERKASEEEKTLLDAANAKRDEWLKANAAVENLIADHISLHDASFRRERDELAFLSGRNAPNDTAAAVSAGLYAHSVSSQIDLFRELCRQAGWAGK